MADRPVLTILAVLLVGTSCSVSRTEKNALSAADSGSRSEAQFFNDIKDMDESETFQYESPERDNTLLGDETVDPNPSKIPSLDPSRSFGLLQPSDIDLADRCFPKPQCNAASRFRTIDGSCNNLLFPVWGQAHTANTRIVQANYFDGIDRPRKAISGRELPNSRHIRTTLFPDADRPAPKHNLLVMQFGQMIAHDTELTIPKTSRTGSAVECCNRDGSTPAILPKSCLPITIPHNDHIAAASSKRCLSNPRAMDTADKGCRIKPVRQLIGVTSFIDASLLYGSDDNTAASLRTFVNGMLRRQAGPNGRSYLPNAKKPSQSCNVANDNAVCYTTGDPRVNIHPDMAVQTISLLRLHNTLCEDLKSINPSWNDERLYQEARRILIGMYQHVTYNEFVPILVGRDYARVNKLLPLIKDFDNGYNQFLNPTTTTSFTAAAFRSLHSYIQGFIDLVNEARKITSQIRLSDFYFKSDIVQNRDNYDSFIRGMLTQHAQGQDQFFTSEISEFMFRVPNKTDGIDLITLDLERGRDFGEPSYNKFRQLCGLRAARTFDDFTDQIKRKNVEALAKLYEHVDDVDYYAAGILEEPKPGAILGHTFQCMVGEMFFRWKFGDRFYYEFGGQMGSFSSDQLNEIRKTTMAFIMCVTSDIQFIQRNAFDVPGNQNPLIPCSSLQKFNLAPWREV